MIKTLQLKFVKTAMTAITVLLLVVICAICGVYTFHSYSDVRTMARMLAENGGIPVPRDDMEDIGNGKGDGPAGPMEGGMDSGNGHDDRDKRFFFQDGKRISPDNAMSSRFFLVRFSDDGEIDYTDTSKIYSVTTQEADEMALEVYESGRESGIRDRFFYFAGNSGGEKTIVFMDISSELSSVLSVMVISFVIAVVCWIFMFVLVTVLSRRAIAPIAENIVRQKQFVTNAGHELKTPLAIIMANTEALELFGGESKWTRNIKSQTQRLSVLMQNLLTLSKMDEADLELPMEEVDLGELIRETAAPFEEPAREKKISYRAETPHINVKVNRETMRQLISILLDNAVKYTPEGGDIHVTAQKEGKYVILREQNTISPEEVEEDTEKLFDRFYRKDGARTQKKGGFGIGLSAARAIAAANKAEISAEYINQQSIVFSVKIMI